MVGFGLALVRNPRIDEIRREHISLHQESAVSVQRMLADLNMAYVVAEETIQITSQERAKQMTTTRTYYIGDLAAVTDLRLGPIANKLVMIDSINRLILTITQTKDPQSWNVNNPDAVGTINFDPITMSLTIKQTAEVHYSLRGR